MQEPNNSCCKILDEMAAENRKEDSFLLNISLFLYLSGSIGIIYLHDHSCGGIVPNVSTKRCQC